MVALEDGLVEAGGAGGLDLRARRQGERLGSDPSAIGFRSDMVGGGFGGWSS